MPKDPDSFVNSDVTDAMEKMVESFPNLFSGFDVSKVSSVHTKGKSSNRRPLSLRAVRYPFSIWMDQTYIIEVANDTWQEMDQKRKNLAVFHIMCAIPEGAFDPEGNHYRQIKRPDYELYEAEFLAAGGIPNWMENDKAQDPMEIPEDDVIRNPVTVEDVANVGV